MLPSHFVKVIKFIFYTESVCRTTKYSNSESSRYIS